MVRKQALGSPQDGAAMRRTISMASSIVRESAEQTPDYWRKSLKERMDGHDKELLARLKNSNITIRMCRNAVEACVYSYESDRILLQKDTRDCLLGLYMNEKFRSSPLEQKARKVVKKVEPPLGLLSKKMKGDIIALYISKTGFFGKFDREAVSAYTEAMRQVGQALDKIFEARNGLKFKEAYRRIMSLPLYEWMRAAFDIIDEGIVRRLITDEIALKLEVPRHVEAADKWRKQAGKTVSEEGKKCPA